jgi:hypothetical protein
MVRRLSPKQEALGSIPRWLALDMRYALINMRYALTAGLQCRHLYPDFESAAS